MSGMALLLFRPFLLAPKDLIVSEDSAKCSEENGMNGVSFTAVRRMPMGWGHVVGQLSSKFTSRSVTRNVEVRYNEGDECCVLVEDVERTLISERGGSCVAVGFACVAVQLSGEDFFTDHNIYILEITRVKQP